MTRESSRVKKNSRRICLWCDWSGIYCHKMDGRKCCKDRSVKGKVRTFIKKDLDELIKEYEAME